MSIHHQPFQFLCVIIISLVFYLTKLLAVMLSAGHLSLFTQELGCKQPKTRQNENNDETEKMKVSRRSVRYHIYVDSYLNPNNLQKVLFQKKVFVCPELSSQSRQNWTGTIQNTDHYQNYNFSRSLYSKRDNMPATLGRVLYEAPARDNDSCFFKKLYIIKTVSSGHCFTVRPLLPSKSHFVLVS